MDKILHSQNGVDPYSEIFTQAWKVTWKLTTVTSFPDVGPEVETLFSKINNLTYLLMISLQPKKVPFLSEFKSIAFKPA